MKKLFSLVTFVLFAFFMMGCESDIDTDRIQELEDSIVSKNNLIEGYELVLSDKEENIAELEDQLSVYEQEALLLGDYDGYFAITVDLGDEEITRYVRYYDDVEATLWDLVKVTFDIQYNSTEWGNQITAIHGMDTPYGSYIAFYINDEFAMTGVESTAFEHQDEYRFVRDWWDSDAKNAYQAIALILDESAEDYIDSLNYLVLIGLNRLGLLEDYSITLDETLPETIGGLVSRVFLENALGLDHTDSTEALYEIKTMGHLYTSSMVYTALKTNPDLDLTSFELQLFEAMENTDVSETDLDTLSMMLVAASYFDTPEATALIGEILEEIEANLYHSSYGDNAATFANVIIGLLSVDKNPLSTRYANEAEENLLEVLVSFQNPDGIFNWTDEPDPTFSTPQAFLALVMIQEYIRTFTGSNPYLFD